MILEARITGFSATETLYSKTISGAYWIEFLCDCCGGARHGEFDVQVPEGCDLTTIPCPFCGETGFADGVLESLKPEMYAEARRAYETEEPED